MSAPFGNVGGQSPQFLEYRINQLEAKLDAVIARGVQNAGAFSVKAPSGTTTFASGPDSQAPMPDGTPQWITIVRDVNGTARMVIWDPNTTVDGFNQSMFIYDHLGQTLYVTDKVGGIAEPWAAVPMTQRFGMAAGPFLYGFVPCNVAEQTLWFGKMRVYHPQIGISGVWGSAIGTNSTRYRLKLNGTTVGTWDEPGGAVVAARGPFNCNPPAAVGNIGVGVELTAQTLSGSGSYACQIDDVQLRGT